jgi:hypothetical protein
MLWPRLFTFVPTKVRAFPATCGAPGQKASTPVAQSAAETEPGCLQSLALDDDQVDGVERRNHVKLPGNVRMPSVAPQAPRQIGAERRYPVAGIAAGLSTVSGGGKRRRYPGHEDRCGENGASHECALHQVPPLPGPLLFSDPTARSYARASPAGRAHERRLTPPCERSRGPTLGPSRRARRGRRRRASR